MEVLLAHNEYGKYSGEESVVATQIRCLDNAGIKVRTYTRESNKIKGLNGEITAFFSGFYNYKVKQEFVDIIEKRRPDVIHIHNLFPLISPSIFSVASKYEIPIVMTVHNYRLMCPNGLYFDGNEICTACTTGFKELNCVLRNCEKNILKSIGYAGRNMSARLTRSYIDGVTEFLPCTDFIKNEMVSAGFSPHSIKVIANITDMAVADESQIVIGDYVAFLGRLSKEKGIGTLIQAAAMMPDTQFIAAGSATDYFTELEKPSNFVYLGKIDREEAASFLRNAAVMVFPSEWYEGFPISILESLSQGTPVLCSDIGALPEINDLNASGLVFKPKEAIDLSVKLKGILNNRSLLKTLSLKAIVKAKIHNDEFLYATQLISSYRRAISIKKSASL